MGWERKETEGAKWQIRSPSLTWNSGSVRESTAMNRGPKHEINEKELGKKTADKKSVKRFPFGIMLRCRKLRRQCLLYKLETGVVLLSAVGQSGHTQQLWMTSRLLARWQHRRMMNVHCVHRNQATDGFTVLFMSQSPLKQTSPLPPAILVITLLSSPNQVKHSTNQCRLHASGCSTLNKNQIRLLCLGPKHLAWHDLSPASLRYDLNYIPIKLLLLSRLT